MGLGLRRLGLFRGFGVLGFRASGIRATAFRVI